MHKLTVIKQNEKGSEIWRYDGHILEQNVEMIILEALFNREDTILNDIVLKRNDRFVEYFFNDRWYNIFEIHDRDDGKIKGWYCDICRPAIITDFQITYQDLSIDLWVYPDGRKSILDRDQFNQLVLDTTTCENALKSLSDLHDHFFEIIKSLPKVRE